MLVRRVVAAVAACSSLALVAGCAEDEPEPKMPEATNSAPSPEPVESEAPEHESAEDFIRRFTEEATRAQVEGDTKAYRAMAPRCEACQSFADRVDEIYERGGSIDFAGVEIQSIARIPGARLAYRVTRSSSETVLLDRSGAVDERLPGGRNVLNLYLTAAADTWLVARMLRAPG